MPTKHTKNETKENLLRRGQPANPREYTLVGIRRDTAKHANYAKGRAHHSNVIAQEFGP